MDGQHEANLIRRRKYPLSGLIGRHCEVTNYAAVPKDTAVADDMNEWKEEISNSKGERDTWFDPPRWDK